MHPCTTLWLHGLFREDTVKLKLPWQKIEESHLTTSEIQSGITLMVWICQDNEDPVGYSKIKFITNTYLSCTAFIYIQVYISTCPRGNVAWMPNVRTKKSTEVSVNSSLSATWSPCMKRIVSALTVHSHSRSQRVSLRGVNRTLPFFCQMDKMYWVWGWRARLALSNLLCRHGDSFHCSRTEERERERKEKKPGSHSPSLSVHGHLLSGTPKPDRYEAAPSESPPPSPYLTAGRQKVITPRHQLLLDTD